MGNIIDKLRPSWKDVKKKLKHQEDDMSLKDHGKHLIVEEQYRPENKTNDDTSEVHVAEENVESSKSLSKRKCEDDKGKKKFNRHKINFHIKVHNTHTHTHNYIIRYI